MSWHMSKVVLHVKHIRLLRVNHRVNCNLYPFLLIVGNM